MRSTWIRSRCCALNRGWRCFPQNGRKNDLGSRFLAFSKQLPRSFFARSPWKTPPSPYTLHSMPGELPDRFLVAFSFAGEQRDLIRRVAERVQHTLGPGNVFLDEWFEHYLAGPDADLRLQQIYGERCALAVVCVSGQQSGRRWNGAEWEAIRARQIEAKSRRMIATDWESCPSALATAISRAFCSVTVTEVPDVRGQSPDQIAELILRRLRQIIPRPMRQPTARA